MLLEEVGTYLSENMQLDVPWLRNELKGWPDNLRIDVYNYINQAMLVTMSDKDLNRINELYNEILEKYEDGPYRAKLVEIWAVFRHFSGLTNPQHKHSVLQLFKVQQAEEWRPKMSIRRILTPNDINLLADDVQVFRGSDLSEYNSGQYGQSWTLSKKIADRFAYEHYQSYDWFDREQRIVMSASIPKSAIFYYETSDSEDELIIDTKYLTNVVKIS